MEMSIVNIERDINWCLGETREGLGRTGWLVLMFIDREKRCRKTSSEKSGKQQLAVTPHTINTMISGIYFLVVRKNVQLR